MPKVPASGASRKLFEAVFSGQDVDPSRMVREATRQMTSKPLEADVERATAVTHDKPKTGDTTGARAANRRWPRR